MKLVLVTARDEIKDRVEAHFSRFGYDLIYYNNPLKAMDNLIEIDPDAVIFSAEDFPRHWKPFLLVLRQVSPREESVFVILTGGKFDEDEAAKAGELNVNAVLDEDLGSEPDLKHLENILNRHRPPASAMKGNFDDVEFLFNHPEKFTMLSGRVMDLGFAGLVFMPDSPELTADIAEGREIPSCSLRIDLHVLAVTVKLIRNNKALVFLITDIDEEDRRIFIECIEKLQM